MNLHHPEPWELFGSAVIEAEALERRVADGPPRDLAGLVIEDDEVDRLLATLPGLSPREDPFTARREVAARLGELREAMHASLESPASGSRFGALARSARLGRPDIEVLATLAAIERSPARQRLLAYAQDDVSATRPWVATLGRLFPGEPPGLLAITEGSRLRRAELLAVTGEGAWATRPVALATRVLWALAGDDSADPGLPRSCEVLPALERRDAPKPGLFLVHGGDRSQRRAEAGRHVGTSIIATALPPDEDGWRALVREATVRGAALMLEVEEPRLPATAAYWVERADHLSWVIASKTPVEIRTLPPVPWTERELASRMATTEEWAEAFGQRPERGHRLDPEALRLARVAYQGLKDVDGAVRRLASGALDELATRIESRRGWDAVVLPPRQERQLRELVGRYQHSATVFDRWGFGGNTGIVALFAGPSGTGKTLSAEVIGTALGLDVYKIDLSSLVSKYIGETEKNLERIFDAASAGNVVLFFDEADALFGKRSEVADSHDRYANIEVAYLLQRIEAYEGIVVLATNLRANMDDAFLRRIHVAVDFREPDEAQRLEIWQLAFPPGAPQEDLDLAWIAQRFRVTGGNIRNAATSAAFLAAEAGRPITMDDVVRGLDREFEKLGRLRTEADFGPYYRIVTSND